MSKSSRRERLQNWLSPMEFLFAVLAGGTGVAGSYVVAGYSRQFIVAPIDSLVVRLTPGKIVAFMIQNVGDAGHLLHIALSFALATGILTIAAGIGINVSRRLDQPVLGILVAGGLAWVITVLITTELVLAIGAALPVIVFTALGATPLRSPGSDPSRRRALLSGAAALSFIGISISVGRILIGSGSGSTTTGGAGDTGTMDKDVEALMAEADEKSLDIAGDIPGLVSTFDEFYNVDIAEFDPSLSPDDWSLTFTGEVGRDTTVTFDELTELPTEQRFLTLRCVGESLNGHKLDNAIWTGTPIKPLLEEADPEGACGCAMLHAEDGYYVQFPIEALEDGFLAWRMNGQSLPQSHGHPVRVLIPGHWGETNVKWLTEIELLDEELDGYWEERGWHGTGPVNTVAKLWSDTQLANGNIEVAGHAYAGTRGIQTVEVSIDGGEGWQAAELSPELPGEDVWRQWRYEFEPDGTHDVVVRAIDGTGTRQTGPDQTDSFPRGATGWVTKTIRP